MSADKVTKSPDISVSSLSGRPDRQDQRMLKKIQTESEQCTESRQTQSGQTATWKDWRKIWRKTRQGQDTDGAFRRRLASNPDSRSSRMIPPVVELEVWLHLWPDLPKSELWLLQSWAFFKVSLYRKNVRLWRHEMNWNYFWGISIQAVPFKNTHCPIQKLISSKYLTFTTHFSLISHIKIIFSIWKM